MYYRNINMGTQWTGLSIHFMATVTSYPTWILLLWFIMMVPEPGKYLWSSQFTDYIYNHLKESFVFGKKMLFLDLLFFISPHYALSLKIKFSNYFITGFLSCTQIGCTFLCSELFVSTPNRSECSGSGWRGEKECWLVGLMQSTVCERNVACSRSHLHLYIA